MTEKVVQLHEPKTIKIIGIFIFTQHYSVFDSMFGVLLVTSHLLIYCHTRFVARRSCKCSATQGALVYEVCADSLRSVRIRACDIRYRNRVPLECFMRIRDRESSSTLSVETCAGSILCEDYGLRDAEQLLLNAFREAPACTRLSAPSPPFVRFYLRFIGEGVRPLNFYPQNKLSRVYPRGYKHIRAHLYLSILCLLSPEFPRCRWIFG